MSKATEAAMAGLHALLADALTSLIRDGVTILSRDGEPVKITTPAAYFKEAREFLKDNGVEALPQANQGLQSLAAALPFPAPGDEEERITTH